MIRAGDVDGLDPIIVEELVQARVGLRHAEAPSARGASLGRRAEEPMDLDTQPAEGLDVHGADEAAADDRRTDLARVPHSTTSSLSRCLDRSGIPSWAHEHGNCTF
jgi:hypothetical protein